MKLKPSEALRSDGAAANAETLCRRSCSDTLPGKSKYALNESPLESVSGRRARERGEMVFGQLAGQRRKLQLREQVAVARVREVALHVIDLLLQ